MIFDQAIFLFFFRIKTKEEKNKDFTCQKSPILTFNIELLF